MNRYIERAENIARILDVKLQLMLDLSVNTTEQWESLLPTTGDHSMFQERFDEATTKNVVAFLTFDPGNPNSIFSCLRVARENARSVREIITAEMWEHVNKFYLMVRDAASAGDFPEAPHDFFDEIKSDSHLYQGITDATMSHGEGWHFGHLGRLMERADQTSRILDVMHSYLLPSITDVDSPIDDIQWSAGLKSASALPRCIASAMDVSRHTMSPISWCSTASSRALCAPALSRLRNHCTPFREHRLVRFATPPSNVWVCCVRS